MSTIVEGEHLADIIVLREGGLWGCELRIAGKLMCTACVHVTLARLFEVVSAQMAGALRESRPSNEPDVPAGGML